MYLGFVISENLLICQRKRFFIKWVQNRNIFSRNILKNVILFEYSEMEIMDPQNNEQILRQIMIIFCK